MAQAAQEPARSERSIGIDLARGVAVVLMVQTHAFDGWVSRQAKAGWGYALSRVFSNIPAPLFLLLAGVGLAFAASAAQRRGTPLPRIRAALCRRAMEVFGYGYVVSAVYALIEGRFELTALLRADILHCIGLSMVLCTQLLVGRAAILARTVLLSSAALAAGVALGQLPAPRGWLAVPLALIYDVPPYTRFPLLPLCGFVAVGAAVGSWLQQKPPLLGSAVRLLAITAVLVALVPVWQHLTALTVSALGGRLSRSHPAVVWNFLEGCTRALAVLTASLLVATLLERRQAQAARGVAWLVRLGRGSLLAYAVHIPLCYSRLARPIAGRLEMPLATVLVAALIGFTYLVVLSRDLVRQRARRSG